MEMSASVRHDDGIFPERGTWLSGFPDLVVDRRRVAIIGDEFDDVKLRQSGEFGHEAVQRGDRGAFWSSAAMFTEDPDVMYLVPDDELQREVWVSWEDMVVSEFRDRFRAVRGARSEEEADEAYSGMEAFLARVEAYPRPRGRHRRLPAEPILRALVAEGAELIRLLWQHLPIEPTERTLDILRARGVPRLAAPLVIARLACPLLSEPELATLMEEADARRKRSRGTDEQPTPLRFAIWVLEHRLRVPASAIAGAARDSRTAAVFKGKGVKNPIPGSRLRRPPR